jgi:pimeloyl-ACP methyl ester carboxylesterase
VEGAGIALTPPELARAYPAASARLVVLVHGLMCTESIWDFPRDVAGKRSGDYGAFLARDFAMSPVYVRYNSGLSIPDNGADLARLLEALVRAWPVAVEEVLLLGYSMGGLVVRAAFHAASVEGMDWLRCARRAIYVGTPHLGAPYERVGRVLAKVAAQVPDPVVRLLAQIGDLRSDGIKDLGDADLRHEDRARRRTAASLRDPEHPVPLLASVRHYLVAASLSTQPTLAALFGDALVPLPSGTNGLRAAPGSRALPPRHVKILADMPHVTLAHHPDVYAQIREWCEEDDERASAGEVSP